MGGRGGLTLPPQPQPVVLKGVVADMEGEAAIGRVGRDGLVDLGPAKPAHGERDPVDAPVGVEGAGRLGSELHVNSVVTQPSAYSLLYGAEEHVAVVDEEGLVAPDKLAAGGLTLGQALPP